MRGRPCAEPAVGAEAWLAPNMSLRLRARSASAARRARPEPTRTPRATEAQRRRQRSCRPSSRTDALERLANLLDGESRHRDGGLDCDRPILLDDAHCNACRFDLDPAVAKLDVEL